MRLASIVRVLVVALAVAAPLGLALAEQPAGKLKGHPNLAAAQKLAMQAFDKLEAAQQANEYDLGGHAAKAKALLQQANAEIKLAAEAADKRDGKK
jgi:hypothetical protein